MTIFDMLFVLILFASVIALAVAAALALVGRYRPASKIVMIFGGCLALYLAAVGLVSLASPQRVLALGEKHCFDDWCIAVEDIARSQSPAGDKYSVTMQLSSRARRISQRENGIVVYMLDEKGRRYEPADDPSAAPFDVLLQPGQSVPTTRSFTTPGASGQLVLVLEHAGANRFPGMFIIGDDSSLYHKPVIVHLP